MRLLTFLFVDDIVLVAVYQLGWLSFDWVSLTVDV